MRGGIRIPDAAKDLPDPTSRTTFETAEQGESLTETVRMLAELAALAAPHAGSPSARSAVPGLMIALQHGNLDARDRLAVIVLLVDQVNRGSADWIAGGQHRFVDPAAIHAGPAMARQERRMDVENAVVEHR